VAIRKLEAEKVFSPAALRIIRRHRPDAEDGRHCRGCGRPMAACDVLALAGLIVDGLRLAMPHAAVEPSPSDSTTGSTIVVPHATFPAQAPRRRVKRTPISA
jgi:ferredoxin